MQTPVKDEIEHIKFLARDAKRLADLLLNFAELDDADREAAGGNAAEIDKMGKAIGRRIRPHVVAAEELERHGRHAEAKRSWEAADSTIHSNAELQGMLEKMMAHHDSLEKMAREYGLLQPRRK